MPFKRSITNELRRSPVSILLTTVGLAIAALGLALAHRTNLPSELPPTITLQPPSNELIIGNILLAVSFFLAATVSGASLIRILAKKYDFAALIASIPLAALTNFFSILVIYLAPPRNITTQLFTSAHDIVFYASTSIYVAFCGMAVIRDLATPSTKKREESDPKSEHQESNGLSALVVSLFLLLVWGSLVLSGQTHLTNTFLPEITHPLEQKNQIIQP
ncbi:hypothetical protein FQZ97_705420 [compost metagenome]